METTPTDEQAITPITETDQCSRDKRKGILLEEDVTDVMNLKPDDLTKPLELKFTENEHLEMSQIRTRQASVSCF